MTRQQKWAKEAYARVTRVATNFENPGAREYRTFCMKMPVLIMQSGLAQALAFIQSRQDPKKPQQDPAKAFSDDLASVYGITGTDPGKGLMAAAQGADELTLYLALTRDIIDVSTWLRRFAQSELPSGGEG